MLGAADVEAKVTDLAARLPGSLRPLARLALDLRWTWLPGAAEAFAALDPATWAASRENPVALLRDVPSDALHRAGNDPGLVRRVQALAAEHERHRAATDEPSVAYLCAEFGLHASLPIYSGGLGALAGDVVKEAADRAAPMVAVGLLYRQGYFRQRLDHSGWQQEHWEQFDPARSPAARVTGQDGRPLTVTVPVGDDDVALLVWRVDVGRVPLLLLDAEHEDNAPALRYITARLYVGDPDVRLRQYAVLGVGGIRALEAVGVDPAVVHLNEGHAAFATVELARRAVGEGADPEAALEQARSRTVFTTHTPVPAGNETFAPEHVAGVLGRVVHDAGLDVDALLARGRTHPHAVHEPFGVTQLALRISRAANGVSRRHGEVAREMWRDLWPELPETPIGHVTNGVHVPTWIGGPMRELLDRRLGEGWAARASEEATWVPVDEIPDAELLAARREQRAVLVAEVGRRSTAERLGRGEQRHVAEAAARGFDPDALTLGFARRVATYKRLHLLFSDPDRVRRLVGGDRPLQVVVAGKAHPRDDEGKHLLQGLFRTKDERLQSRVVVLEDYDLRLAATMVRGCDVWVNVPRPPLEASGTSGMKAAMNGALNLSVLDGWWAEAFDGVNGWGLSGDVDPDHAADDARVAWDLMDTVEHQVVPLFADPAGWCAKVRASLRTIGPAFAAGRMLEGYRQRLYEPSAVGSS